MSVTVKQIGQLSAQLKSQIDQFQSSIDQNEQIIEQLKNHFVDSNVKLEGLSGSLASRQSDLDRTKESLEYADMCVKDMQSDTSTLDNDTMLTARLWEAAVSSSTNSQDAFFNRAFSSGRVAFTVPSNFFESLATKSIVNGTSLENLAVELKRIEEYYQQQLKEGRGPADISNKVRSAMVYKLHELKPTISTKH